MAGKDYKVERRKQLNKCPALSGLGHWNAVVTFLKACISSLNRSLSRNESHFREQSSLPGVRECSVVAVHTLTRRNDVVIM